LPHPRFVGLRRDKDPGEVVRESGKPGGFPRSRIAFGDAADAALRPATYVARLRVHAIFAIAGLRRANFGGARNAKEM
jgi:hypothetical protein